MKRSSTVSTPAKRSRTKTATKRTSKKSFYAVPRPLVQYKTGFPKQLAITHKYSQEGRLTYIGPNANVQYYAFGVNCLYDPYLALGGGQPLYFDQLSAIYNHYTVMRSRIKVTFIRIGTKVLLQSIYIDDDDTPAATNLETIVQQPSAVSKTSQRDVEVCTVYKSWDCKSVFGPNPLDNDRLQGDVANNPAETQAFIAFVRPIVQVSTDTTLYDVHVQIEFDTIWNELKVMASS